MQQFSHSVDAVLHYLILYSVLVYADVAEQRTVLMKSTAHPTVLNSLFSHPWHLPPYTHTVSVFLLLTSSSPPIRPLGAVTNVTYVVDRPAQIT